MAIQKSKLINEGTEILKSENDKTLKKFNNNQKMTQVQSSEMTQVQKTNIDDDIQANIPSKTTPGKISKKDEDSFKLRVELNAVVVCLFLAAFALRFYELDHPNAVV